MDPNSPTSPTWGGDATHQGDSRLELSPLQLQGQGDMETHSSSPRSFQLEVWGATGVLLGVGGDAGGALSF